MLSNSYNRKKYDIIDEFKNINFIKFNNSINIYKNK